MFLMIFKVYLETFVVEFYQLGVVVIGSLITRPPASRFTAIINKAGDLVVNNQLSLFLVDKHINVLGLKQAIHVGQKTIPNTDYGQVCVWVLKITCISLF